MSVEVKQVSFEEEVYVQWDNRCGVCWHEQTPLCNNANCDGVRN